jgi:integrase
MIAAIDVAVREAFRFWAEIIRGKSRTKSEATQNQVSYCLDAFIIPFFGEKKITEVDEATILAFIDWVEAKGKKPWTHLKQLRKILTYAWKKGAITALPDFDFDVSFPFREGHYLSRTQLALLMWNAGRDVRLQIFLSYRHSFRKNEVFRISRSNTVLDQGVVVIHSKHSKTRRRRIVTLSKTATRILKARFGRAVRAEYLFPSPEGDGPVQSNVRALKNALRRAGLPSTIKFHDLRKTFASNAINSGFPIELVARVGGFSPKTIREHYYIAADREARKLVDARPGTSYDTSLQPRSVENAGSTSQTPDLVTTIASCSHCERL